MNKVIVSYVLIFLFYGNIHSQVFDSLRIQEKHTEYNKAISEKTVDEFIEFLPNGSKSLERKIFKVGDSNIRLITVDSYYQSQDSKDTLLVTIKSNFHFTVTKIMYSDNKKLFFESKYKQGPYGINNIQNITNEEILKLPQVSIWLKESEFFLKQIDTFNSSGTLLGSNYFNDFGDTILSRTMDYDLNENLIRYKVKSVLAPKKSFIKTYDYDGQNNCTRELQLDYLRDTVNYEKREYDVNRNVLLQSSLLNPKIFFMSNPEYLNGKLISSVTRNNLNELLYSENLFYDDKGRLIKREFIPTSKGSVKTIITYYEYY